MTDEDVRHVARLARLALTDAEIAVARDELSAIVGYVALLGELDLDGVAPAPYPLPMELPVRPDEPAATLDPESATGNAPAREDGAFVVPRVIG